MYDKFDILRLQVKIQPMFQTTDCDFRSIEDRLINLGLTLARSKGMQRVLSMVPVSSQIVDILNTGFECNLII